MENSADQEKVMKNDEYVLDKLQQEYWIVDPIKEQLIVYKFEKETMEQYSFGEEISVGIYEGFSIKIQ